MTKNRNIQQVAPFLAEDFIDLDEPVFDVAKYKRYINNNSERLGIFRKYLIEKLHDSWITDFYLDSDKFQFSLNDFSTHVFSDAIVKRFNITIDHDKFVFPVIIEFLGDLQVNFYSVDEDGGLMSIDPININQYLGEQIQNLSTDKLEIEFEVWHDNPNQNLPDTRNLIIVSANALRLTENQDSAWNEIFGKTYDDYYRYFKEQFESERYVSDYSTCLTLVDEYDLKAKNRQYYI